jgi:hypothetical protein
VIPFYRSPKNVGRGASLACPVCGRPILETEFNLHMINHGWGLAEASRARARAGGKLSQ